MDYNEVILESLRSRLNAVSCKDSRHLYVGAGRFSANELLLEIEQGTAIGDNFYSKHTRLLLNHPERVKGSALAEAVKQEAKRLGIRKE